MPHMSTSIHPASGSSVQDVTHCVEFLYFEDCPSHERALEIVEEALREEQIPAELHVYRVETDEEAERIRFPGSPTIRINGVDVEENPDLPIGLSCRAYRHENGRISPLPSKDKIVQAIRQAMRDPLSAASARQGHEFSLCR